MSTRPVVVVGDVGLDVITRPHGPISWASDTPSAVTMASGGAGGNSASWLAWASVPVTLLARVGEDAAGQAARAELESKKVRCAFASDPHLPTCVVVILLDEHGERTMLADRGANQAFSPADVALAELDLGSDLTPHLHLSGYVLYDEGSRAGGLEALRQARELGWTISVDPQASALIHSVGADAFLGWVEGVDLLFPNAREVEALGGFERILEASREVIATYGPNGAAWIGPGFNESAQAPTIHRVDSTGAGDAFNAGLLSVWLTGRDRMAALRAGIEAGSTACTRVGARPR